MLTHLPRRAVTTITTSIPPLPLLSPFSVSLISSSSSSHVLPSLPSSISTSCNVHASSSSFVCSFFSTYLSGITHVMNHSQCTRTDIPPPDPVFRSHLISPTLPRPLTCCSTRNVSLYHYHVLAS